MYRFTYHFHSIFLLLLLLLDEDQDDPMRYSTFRTCRPLPYLSRIAPSTLTSIGVMEEVGGNASDPGARQERLPEIPLQWTDFMWALEKLRHRPYSKKTRER